MSWSQDVAAAFTAHRALLWALSYRLTGCGADADDVLQETFLRALQHPPARLDLPLRPWLIRVALNLGRDVLRRRRRRPYDGPWLPSPLPTPDLQPHEQVSHEASPAARYEQTESLSTAFLLALEALRPTPRAVLLLRDVLDYSVRETAEALDMSDVNVKVTHLRARRALARYDRERVTPSPASRARTAAALERLMTCLAQGDAAGLAALLCADVRARSDAGGEFVAARQPILGRERVARFLLGLAAKARAMRVEWRSLNHAPALVLDAQQPQPGWAARTALQCVVDQDGLIVELLTVLASRKLRDLG